MRVVFQWAARASPSSKPCLPSTKYAVRPCLRSPIFTSKAPLSRQIHTTLRQAQEQTKQSSKQLSRASQSWNPTIRSLAARKTPVLLFQGRSRAPNLVIRLVVGMMCYAYAGFHFYATVINPPEGFHPLLRRGVQVVVIIMFGFGSFVIFRRIRAVRSITAVPATATASGQQQPLLLKIQISRIIPYGPKTITVPCKDVSLTQPLYVEALDQIAGDAGKSSTNLLTILITPFRLFGQGISRFYAEFQNLFWQQDNPLLIVKGYRGTWNIDAEKGSFALDNGTRLNDVVRTTFS